MTCLWRIPQSYPDSLIGEYDRTVSPDRFQFRRGQAVAAGLAPAVIRFDAPRERLLAYACLPNNAMVPLVSKSLGALLTERAAGDIQLLAARIVASDGEIDSYALLNVSAKVIGIDKTNSQFTLVPGTQQILSFTKLSYLEGCMGAHQLARDAEYLPHLLVADGMAAALSGRWDGIELVPL